MARIALLTSLTETRNCKADQVFLQTDGQIYDYLKSGQGDSIIGSRNGKCEGPIPSHWGGPSEGHLNPRAVHS